MEKYKNIFERKEKKYVMSLATQKQLLNSLLEHMELDHHGLHTICSLYYDTPDYWFIRQSIDKPTYKEKFRVRSYGIPTAEDKIFLELKKKIRGIVYKRRIPLSLTVGNHYLRTGQYDQTSDQIFREIDWFLRRYNPEPKVLISYDRIALAGIEDPDFRITFDFKIRWRDEALDLALGDTGEPLLQDDFCLMEVKALGAIPIWLTQLLANKEIYSSSFSKYGNCYKQHLMRKGGEISC